MSCQAQYEEDNNAEQVYRSDRMFQVLTGPYSPGGVTRNSIQDKCRQHLCAPDNHSCRQYGTYCNAVMHPTDVLMGFALANMHEYKEQYVSNSYDDRKIGGVNKNVEYNIIMLPDSNRKSVTVKSILMKEY
jgi:hypothetical protein